MGANENTTYDATTTKPDPYTAVVLYFADGSRKGGIWTGSVWWSEGRSAEPQRWQRMPVPPKEENK